MMSRRYLSLFAAMLVATASAAARAESVIVIGNFEGQANNTDSLEGWTGQGGAVAKVFNNPQTATSGTGALSLVTGTNFIWGLRIDNNARPTLGADILSHPLLRADVTWVTAQWSDSTPGDTTDNWAKWEKLAVNDNTGWQENPISSDPVNPGFPGSWDSVNYGAVHTRTLEWNMANQVIDTSGFVQLWIATNMSSSSFPQGSRFWIDNIRLVGPDIPEPATLGLAGMAILGLGLRRRAR